MRKLEGGGMGKKSKKKAPKEKASKKKAPKEKPSKKGAKKRRVAAAEHAARLDLADLKRSELVALLDSTRRERDAMQAERAEAIAENERLMATYGEALAERDSLEESLSALQDDYRRLANDRGVADGWQAASAEAGAQDAASLGAGARHTALERSLQEARALFDEIVASGD